MSEKRNMNGLEKDDILQKEYLRENPYTLPDNYFASVEDAVHKRIHKEESGFNPLLAFLGQSLWHRIRVWLWCNVSYRNP